MNIELLTETLEISENPGLDTFDPRFNDIATMVQQADYMGAAAEAEKIFQEQVYDIRIIGYFLYGIFIDQGAGMLGPIFECLTGLLDENWEAIGPAGKREKHTQTSLNWFMKQLVKKLEYEETNKGELWDRWIEEVSIDEVQQALEAGEKLGQTLGRVLEDLASQVTDGLSKVSAWLESFRHLVYREPEPEPEPETEEALDEEEKKQTPPSSFSGTGDGVSVEGSYHLQLLLRKINVFEQLINLKQFDRAALVSGDINDIIANFDPKIYFPRIFARFSLLLALNIGELLAFEEHKGSPEWQSLQELYKVDLDSFVAFDADIDFSAGPVASAPDYDQDEYDEQPPDEGGEEPDDDEKPEEDWD
jgi:hypothetical protein